MSSNNEQQENAAPAAEPSALKRIVPMVLAVSVGLFVGGTAGVLVAGPVMAEKAVARAEVVAEEVVARVASGELGGQGRKATGEKGLPIAAPVYRVENIVLNPAQSGGTRFLVASLALEVADSSTTTSMQQRDAEVRDAILRVLGGKTVVQLADPEGRPALKQELLTAVDSIFGGKSVSAVYLPQFVIQ